MKSILYGILLIVVIGELISILFEHTGKDRTGFIVKMAILFWIVSNLFI